MTAMRYLTIGMPKSRLGREIVVVLFVKLAIISLAAIFIFGPNQRPRINAAKVAAHLVDPPPSAATPVTLGIPQRKTP
jgi:hypothetical protein